MVYFFNVIYVYVKSQIKTLLFLILFIIGPYLLVIETMPQVPYMPYFFIFTLFMLRLLIDNPQSAKKKLTSRAQRELTKELKRNPSGSEIFKRIEFYLRCKDFSLLLAGIIILIVGIFTKQF
jgi:hypothetical protein